ncbi:MAG: RNA pseudouridine synthase [Bryobacteraceae bacterium]|nr:RNA pseudouridine synthase [Bryobacteraceae bacterium]
MPKTEAGWIISPDELRAWILEERPAWLVVNKPAGVLCHPSKHGPWSSLVSAARQYLGEPVLHMPSRLDRETSGVVVLVRQRELGSRMQRAIQEGRVRKRYLAVLEGTMEEPRVVDLPIGRALGSQVILKQAVREDGQPSRTRFLPLAHRGGRTLARVEPETGRLHQIRVHAAAIGHPVCGDKIYGPDETLFLEFIRQGFTDRLRRMLGAERQMLHAEELVFELGAEPLRFHAPLAEDMRAFWESLG